MKARELQIYLGTARTVHARDGLICVASAYIHNLVSLNVETGHLSYALGGRPKDVELEKICQGLESLTKEQREYYWNGSDDIKNPIALYYADDRGNVKTAITDSLDFPNVTDDGLLIYSNTHFESEKELLDYEINNAKLAIKWLNQSVSEKYKAWMESRKLLSDHKYKVYKLELSLIEVIENAK
ncbi:hypothetical phage protein [Psychrobacter phage Psymv2]|uniref:hypothetical protein n=1 Tax=Psychrobacter phage Psymv2 TaxID=1071177 RepID=UPI00022A3795|nr:hypothetical protein CJ96_gp03 [Psychrobacter phage Psymv2]AEO00984.1 hypothetical phage protein [Psychrobacter phage Psymv2]